MHAVDQWNKTEELRDRLICITLYMAKMSLKISENNIRSVWSNLHKWKTLTTLKYWKNISWIRKLHTTEMSIVPKLVYRLETISLQFLGNQTWVCWPAHSKTNLPTPGDGEGKDSVTQGQGRVWAANVQKTWTLGELQGNVF